MLSNKLDSDRNEYFSNFFSQSNNPAIFLSSTGEILDYNNALLKLYDLSSNQIHNKNYFACFQEHHITPAFSSISEILSNPAKSTLTVASNNLTGVKTIQWSTLIIKNRDDVKNICIYGVDISPFVNESMMTKKIQGSIIDHLPPNQFIFWKDEEGVYLGCNEAFAQSLGFKSPSEVIGKTDYDFPVKKEDSDAYRADDKEVMSSRKPKLDIEEPQTLASGETRVLLTNKVPLVDEDNQVYGVLAVYSDITEMKKMSLSLQKALTAAEAASAAKTEFIRNMSHDIRTPLTGIIGMANIIEYQTPVDGAKDIREAGEALLNLLNEIIETVQIESGDVKHEKECFTLKTTFNALTAIFRPAVKQKGLTLETYYDDNIPEVLFGQVLILHRIILNLLGNAVKFTEKGSISLEASLSQKNTDKVVLKFVVSDTGIGIPTEKQQVIFDKFSRLSPSYSNNYKGSGLGLYLVKEFIKKLGGDIKVNSTLGKGSSFICTLPFKIPTPAQLKENRCEHEDFSNYIDHKNEEIIKPKQQGSKIIPAVSDTKALTNNEKLCALLVEDNPLPRKAAEGLLIKEGYTVITAETMQEAIEKSLQVTFDLIYMDIGLPDGSGIDVTKSIRENPSNPNVNTYIVALTAHADPQIEKECLASGMQDVFNKPLDTKKIEIAEINMNNRLLSKSPINHNQNEPTSISELPILDLELNIKITGGNETLAKDMLKMLIEQLPDFQEKITSAYQKQDWPMLKHHVHKLHGGLCYSGAVRLKTIIKNFEVALNKGTDNYADFYDQLLQGIKATESEYKKIEK